MSYYQPPMGDYKTYGYSGDPGFLSSLWKGFKKIAPAIIGTVIGGPVGGMIGAGLGGGGTPPIMPQAAGPMMGGAITFPGGVRVSGALPVPTRGPRGFPKLPATYKAQVAAAAAGGLPAGACPTGYHYAKDGSGRLVRNRRMNVANPRALRRSMRRVQGFEKLAKRTIQFTRRVKMKKRGS
ncbi:MAG: hypothetical protein V3S55_01315 [Nitrospiraceae bacterium]